MQQQAKVRVNTNGGTRGMWLVNDRIQREMNLEKFGRGVDGSSHRGLCGGGRSADDEAPMD